MDIVDPAIEAYLRGLQPTEDPVLLAMEEEAERSGFPIIGPLVGRLCRLLAATAGANRVFELGSGYGYSTAYFAQAVGADGEVVHTDLDPVNTKAAKEFLHRMGLADRVRFETGEALAIAKRIGGTWDVVFVDIDKQDYPAALAWAREHLRPGGLLIVDNALWSGRVVDPDGDAMTRGVVAFNDALFAADDLEAVIVPLRDGVAVARKRAAA